MTDPAPPRPRGFLLLVAALAVLSVGGLAMGRAWPRLSEFFGTFTNIPVPGGDFVLSDGAGPWRLSERAAGKTLVLLYFGFTRCPDLCPATLDRLAGALRELAPRERERVLVVFVSVDHRSDSPADAARYAAHFGPSFAGVSGDSVALDRVVGRYGAAYSFTPLPGSAMTYTVDHTGDVFLLRPSGHVLGRLRAEDRRVDVARVLRRHL